MLGFWCVGSFLFVCFVVGGQKKNPCKHLSSEITRSTNGSCRVTFHTSWILICPNFLAVSAVLAQVCIFQGAEKTNVLLGLNGLLAPCFQMIIKM